MLTDTTNPDQSETGSNVNAGVVSGERERF